MPTRRPVSRSLLGRLTLAAVATVGFGLDANARPDYVELEADDFVLVSAAGERRTRDIAAELSTFRAAMEAVFGLRVNLAAPTRIYALSSSDWRRIAPPRRDVAGYFVPQPFASDLLFDAEADDPRAFELLFHEYTHHVLRSLATGRYPAFFDEGLAEVFSTATFSDDVVRFAPRAEHVSFLRRREWIPFARLLEIERRDTEYVDHALAPAFYAQAWATMYYAVASNSTFGNRLLDYIRDLNSGVPEAAAAEGLIGDNREIARFVRARKPLPVAELRIGGAADVRAVPVRRLSETQRDLTLGELLLRIGNRREAALAILRGAGGDGADRIRGRIAEGLVHLQAGDRLAARDMLDAVDSAADLPPPQAMMLARGLFQLSVHEPGARDPAGDADRSRLLRARSLFAAALSDRRSWVEATHGYVLASLALHEHDGALLAMAKKAYAAAPKNAELAVSIAILHELDGSATLARRYWTEAARSVHEGPSRTRILQELATDVPMPSAAPSSND